MIPLHPTLDPSIGRGANFMIEFLRHGAESASRHVQLLSRREAKELVDDLWAFVHFTDELGELAGEDVPPETTPGEADETDALRFVIEAMRAGPEVTGRRLAALEPVDRMTLEMALGRLSDAVESIALGYDDWAARFWPDWYTATNPEPPTSFLEMP